jgi:uncharacterized coiled-coil protein SlyX
LKPVTYEYKPEIDPNGIPQFGLVAEDVEKACSNLVVRDKDGKPYAVRYDAVNVMLLNEFLKQHDRVSKLEERNAKLETAVSEQAKTLAQEQRDFQTALAQIKNLTANLKEQATLLQKVSAQVQAGNPAPRVVSNND